MKLSILAALAMIGLCSWAQADTPPPSVSPMETFVGEGKINELAQILSDLDAFDIKDQIEKWADFRIFGITETAGILKVENIDTGKFRIKH